MHNTLNPPLTTRFAITLGNLYEIIWLIEQAQKEVHNGEAKMAIELLTKAKKLEKILVSPDIGCLINAIKRKKERDK